MPGDLGWTCGDYARVLCFKYCTRGYGCGGHPAFPTPSLGEGFVHTSGHHCRENAESHLNVIARGAATKQSILLLCDQTGLLRFARNDGLKWLFEN
jgi:hypothetical protein